MNLKDWAHKERGRQAALAAFLGVPAPNVSCWVMGVKSPSIKTAVAIENFTEGQVSRREIFPDSWGDIWPELITPDFPWPAANKSAEGVSHG